MPIAAIGVLVIAWISRADTVAHDSRDSDSVRIVLIVAAETAAYAGCPTVYRSIISVREEHRSLCR
jgi:hypothetical protein